MKLRNAGLLPALLLMGCAARQTYRLTPRAILPPGVTDPAMPARRFDFRLQHPTSSKCRATNDALRVEPHRQFLRITVERGPLLAHPAPWLVDWAIALEQQGCLSTAERAALAERVVESLPLNSSDAYRLLHSGAALTGYLDLSPGYRLKVISPILRTGAATNASALATESVSGNDSKLSLTVKSSKDFLGYEISWYAIEPRPTGPALQVRFAKGESHVGDEVTNLQRPRINYFPFPDQSAFFRLFYLTRVSAADHNVAILSAPTRADLDAQTPAFNRDPDACNRASAQMCIALPKEVAVTTYLAVTANGSPVDVPVDSNIGDVVRAAGVAKPASVLPTLQVRRSYRGSLIPLEFDRNQPEILRVIVTGREDLRW